MWFRRGETNPKRREKTPIKSVISFNEKYYKNQVKEENKRIKQYSISNEMSMTSTPFNHYKSID